MKLSYILKNITAKFKKDISTALQTAKDYTDTELAALEPKCASACGYIVSGNNGLAGYGVATAYITGDKVRVDFAFSVAASGSSGFAWGLNSIRISNINPNIPKFKPVASPCGTCTYYTSGAVNGSLTGYGGTVNEVAAYPQLFGFGRIYNTSGSNGMWSENSIGVNTYIVGTCYGEIYS